MYVLYAVYGVYICAYDIFQTLVNIFFYLRSKNGLLIVNST